MQQSAARGGQHECAHIEALVFTQELYQVIAPADLVLLHVFTFLRGAFCAEKMLAHHHSRASPPLSC
jgi:hypothetical protein